MPVKRDGSAHKDSVCGVAHCRVMLQFQRCTSTLLVPHVFLTQIPDDQYGFFLKDVSLSTMQPIKRKHPG